MGRRMDITYYYHSGFSVAAGNILLVFDYWLGEHQELARERRISEDELSRFDEIYVFISHSHPDHWDNEVYRWRETVENITYIVSYEMPVGTRGRRMNPGDEIRLSNEVTVKAFDSTDLGVSFLVDVGGVHIFHAGDLNFWHWREESTVQEIDEAEAAFHAAVRPIIGEPIDIAFFPVDPRQGRLFDAGANYFIMTVKPRLLIPMHFWGRDEVVTEFARRERTRETEIIAMTHPKQRMEIDFADDGFMNINLPAAASDRMDVFRDTDLPVELDGRE